MPPAAVETMFTYDALTAMVVTTAFAGGAWLLRGVTAGGAVAGFAIAFAIFQSAGAGAFAALVAVFTVAWVTTRFGWRRKRALGIADDVRGRTAAQVAANLGAAAVLCVLSAATRHSLFLLAAMAALAEAAADTAASECGEALSERAYLITSLEAVCAGTDGGVSLPGGAAAMVAAAVVACVAAATHVIAWSTLPIVFGAATLGTIVDSVLGATLERRGMVGNNGVNLAGTVAAAAAALLLGYLR